MQVFRIHSDIENYHFKDSRFYFVDRYCNFAIECCCILVRKSSRTMTWKYLTLLKQSITFHTPYSVPIQTYRFCTTWFIGSFVAVSVSLSFSHSLSYNDLIILYILNRSSLCKLKDFSFRFHFQVWWTLNIKQPHNNHFLYYTQTLSISIFLS